MRIFSLPNIISEFKCSTKLALPLIATEIIYALNGFIATIMVAHLGQEELAANALVWSIYLAVTVFFVGILCVTSTMVSQSFGAKDDVGISICFKQGLIMAIILALPMMLIMWSTPVVLVWTKQDPAVIRAAQPFFYSLIWVMLPLNIFCVIEQFLIGILKTRLVMFLTTLSVPTGIFFSYAFLFGKFGLPKAGLAGVGYGWAVAYSLMAVYCIGYVLFSKKLKKYSLFKQWWVVESKFLFEMIRIGLPMGLMWCSELIFFAVVAIMMGVLGTTVLAAYQIADQYLMIALVVLFGLHQCISIRVGNEVGKNNRNKLHLILAVNIGIGLAFLSIFSIFYSIYPQVAISLDIDVNSPDFMAVAFEAAKFFPIVGILLLSDCIRIVSAGALRGLKDVNFQLVISLFGFWGIAFPISYLLAFKFGWGGVGIWWGTVIGLFVTGVMFLVRFYRLAKSADLELLVTRKD
ncbi:MAG: MATE family efflux transporter [bacterium]